MVIILTTLPWWHWPHNSVTESEYIRLKAVIFLTNIRILMLVTEIRRGGTNWISYMSFTYRSCTNWGKNRQHFSTNPVRFANSAFKCSHKVQNESSDAMMTGTVRDSALRPCKEFSLRSALHGRAVITQSVQRWAMGWTIGVLGFDSRRGLGIFLFPNASRTALRPAQSPIQWVPGALSLGVKRPGREADHSPPFSAEVKEWVELYLHSPIRLHGVVLS
jgi:hypothetical protein